MFKNRTKKRDKYAPVIGGMISAVILLLLSDISMSPIKFIILVLILGCISFVINIVVMDTVNYLKRKGEGRKEYMSKSSQGWRLFKIE